VKLKLFASLVSLGVLAGCATSNPDRDIASVRSNVTGFNADLMLDNRLPGSDIDAETVWLDASRILDGIKQNYYLEVRYQASPRQGLIDIPPGQSLFIEVDGERLIFSGIGSEELRNVDNLGIVVERAIYPAQPEQLRKIASAGNVVVEIRGRSGSVRRTFQKQNFDKFKKFVDNYVL
jgi:hypothetical protein